MKYTRPWRYTYDAYLNSGCQRDYSDAEWWATCLPVSSGPLSGELSLISDMISRRADFVTSNLPFYTQITQLYLTRAALYDLSFDPTA